MLVDATNPIKPDYSGLATNGTSGAEEIQAKAPGARVVKAFNTAFAARQTDPKVAGGLRVDGYVAGDDEDAKATVLGLVEAIGFNPVDAGGLAMARYLEGMAWLNITPADEERLELAGRLEARRAGGRRELTPQTQRRRPRQRRCETGRGGHRPPRPVSSAGSCRHAVETVRQAGAASHVPSASSHAGLPSSCTAELRRTRPGVHVVTMATKNPMSVTPPAIIRPVENPSAIA